MALTAQRQLAVDAALLFELGEPPQLRKRRTGALMRGQHPGQVAGRGNRRTDTTPERLPPRRTPEIVVAARARRNSNDLQLTQPGTQRVRLLARFHQHTVAAVSGTRVEVVEREVEPPQVLGPCRGNDVDPTGGLVGPWITRAKPPITM